MASSSSCVPNKSYKYDVFLSFRGEDTRKNFVDHLYAALDQQGICTFKDDERLEKGKEIKDDLLQSIEESRLYIIVFSKRYASSSWCLNELLKIMECHKTNEHIAFPVFYNVDPSEVRKQSGLVGRALATHKDKSESEIGKWRKALTEAANLSGWDVRMTANGHEAKVIKIIVAQVSLELRSIDINVDGDLVGMEQRMKAVDPCLEIGVNDIRMIGIKGMGGAGKTTLAQAIFDKISFNFEGKSFVENVREKASKDGLEKLQEDILKDVLKDESITIRGVLQGKNLMKNKLHGQKVILVLDDVDHKDQLEALAGYPNWFKRGSIIIITTRDEQVLTSHGVKRIHDVNLLTDEEAIRLFRMHAFRQDIPNKEYAMQSLEVVRYAAGLPLTIKVLGSTLCGKDETEWIDILARLKKIPLKETVEKLELSYESLEDDYKKMFLDVACFSTYRMKGKAIRMLESCGFHARSGLRVLQQKSLITIDKENRIDMHDHIEEMGKNIVQRENYDEPHRRSRLWVQEEIEHVLANDLGTEAIRCIDFRITRGIVLEGLGNMKKLRCLSVNNGKVGNFSNESVISDEARQYFPNSIQYLYWYEYPHSCLPGTFEANNLVTLEMSDSEIILWEGDKVMNNLKFLDLSFSKLRSLDLGLTPNLETLNLGSCRDLVKFYVPDGKVMKKLKFLYLSYSKLRSLDLGLTPNLQRLDLQSCYDLVRLCVQGGCSKSLVYLNLSHTRLESCVFVKELESVEALYISVVDMREFSDFIIAGRSNNSLLNLKLVESPIEEVHLASIGNLHKLVSLSLSWCKKLKSLPGSICSLQHLRTLYLHFSSIKELPEDLGQLESLEELHFSFTDVKHLPRSICMLKRLKNLILQFCTLLEKLPEDIGQLESLEILDLGYCSSLGYIPNSICKLKLLINLKLDGCERLEKLPDDLGDIECLQLLDIERTAITHLPESLSLLKRLKIYRSELKDQISDDDFIQLCSEFDSGNGLIQGFKHLRGLDLGGCGIEKVPEALELLDCLEELYLNRTKVKRLPDTICMLKHLKKLSLARCVYLEKLPEDVGQLESLEELYMSRCYNIRNIPNSICMLKHLKMLDLRYCSGIEVLPEALGNLECLEELNISNTDVKQLPDSICMLKHLKELVLQHCVFLEKLPNDVGHLESLERLYLAWCYSIREIPSNICMLKQLKILSLYHCFCLEKLPEDVGQLESLEELYITRCYNIREIPSSIRMLKHLRLLNLDGCGRVEVLSDELGDYIFGILDSCPKIDSYYTPIPVELNREEPSERGCADEEIKRLKTIWKKFQQEKGN